jgi:hypothetical protein
MKPNKQNKTAQIPIENLVMHLNTETGQEKN